METRKKEEKEFTTIQKIRLFLMDLFKMPAINGQRRFIKNVFTGKMEWTKGNVLYETTLDELKPEPIADENVRKWEWTEDVQDIPVEPIITKKIEVSFESQSTLHYEPYREHGWIFEFPGIDSYLFQKIESSDSQTNVEIILTTNCELLNKLEEYKLLSSNLRKRKIGKDAILKMVDISGKASCSYVYKNIEILNVNFFDSLSYDREGIITANIYFKHEPRKLLTNGDVNIEEEKIIKTPIKKKVIRKKAPIKKVKPKSKKILLN